MTPQEKRTRRLSILTTLLELAGAGGIAYGVSLIWVPAAIILGGIELIALSFLLVRSAR